MTEAQRIKPAAIRKTLRVRADRDKAFRVFTAQVGSWWPASHSVLKHVTESPQVDVIIEPSAGGRWYELAEDGAQYDIGRVLAWEPPGRLLLAWQLTREWAYDPEFETVVEVTFAEERVMPSGPRVSA